MPRNLLSEFLAMPDANQVGQYFLFGTNASNDQDTAYIGQSGLVGDRLVQHNKDETKDWNTALILVSITNNLTQTHALYLESMSISLAKKCARYLISNSTNGTKTHTPAPLKADCEDIHETGAMLLATLGYPIFEPLLSVEATSDDKLFCTRAGVNGHGYYTSEGFVILKGSEGRLDAGVGTTENILRIRKNLIDSGVIVTESGKAIFSRDYLFKTPSAASCALLVSASNGWIDWKNEKGLTLSELKRDNTNNDTQA